MLDRMETVRVGLPCRGHSRASLDNQWRSRRRVDQSRDRIEVSIDRILPVLQYPRAQVPPSSLTAYARHV